MPFAALRFVTGGEGDILGYYPSQTGFKGVLEHPRGKET